MKNLLSDNLVAKYRSVPEFLWYIFAAVSAFFANAYDTIVSAGVEVKSFNEMLVEIELPLTVNAVAFIVLSCVLSAVFSTLIFEIINHIVSGVLLARFGAKTNRSDLKFRLRLCFIYANLLTGLIGVSYFFTQLTDGAYTGVFTLDSYLQNDVRTILNCFLPYSAMTFFAFLFFEDVRVRFLPKRNQLRALAFIGRIYFGISILYSLIQCLVLLDNSRSVLTIVTDWVDLGVRVLWAGGAFLYYTYLKKKSSNDDGNDSSNVTVVIEQTPQKNIYDDFGF